MYINMCHWWPMYMFESSQHTISSLFCHWSREVDQQPIKRRLMPSNLSKIVCSWIKNMHCILEVSLSDSSYPETEFHKSEVCHMWRQRSVTTSPSTVRRGAGVHDTKCNWRTGTNRLAGITLNHLHKRHQKWGPLLTNSVSSISCLMRTG